MLKFYDYNILLDCSLSS